MFLLEARELKNRTINAKVVSEGLGFFEQAWQAATPKQRKDLMRLHIHRIIWTPEQIKMGLYTRPTSEMYIKPTAVNPLSGFAVDSINWLPKFPAILLASISQSRRSGSASCT